LISLFEKGHFLFFVFGYGDYPLHESCRLDGIERIAEVIAVGRYADDTETASWEPVVGANSYRFQAISTLDENFEQPIFYKFISSESNSHSLPFTQSYLWRVQAIDCFGNAGVWSNPVYMYKID